MKITFGKYRGTELEDLDAPFGDSIAAREYIEWGAKNLNFPFWREAFKERLNELNGNPTTDKKYRRATKQLSKLPKPIAIVLKTINKWYKYCFVFITNLFKKK